MNNRELIECAIGRLLTAMRLQDTGDKLLCFEDVDALKPQSTVSICKTFGPCKADCNAELRGCQDLRFEDGDRGSCIVTDGSRSACVKNLGCDDRTTACYDQTIYISGSAYSFE